MKFFMNILKPSRGFAHLLYVLLNISLPFIMLLLVKTSFLWVALAMLLISKWRMFAVRPRFWGANIKTNGIDIIVGLSVLAAMVVSPTDWYRLGFALAWAVWLVALKPRISVLWVSLQALIGLSAGFMALFSYAPHASLIWLVLGAGLVSYFAAHHFFYSFDEPYTALLAYLWGYFGAALTWIMGHWLIFYWVIAQPTLLMVALSFVIGTLYYLDHFDKLSKFVRREIIFVAVAIVLISWSALMYFHLLHGSRIVV